MLFWSKRKSLDKFKGNRAHKYTNIYVTIMSRPYVNYFSDVLNYMTLYDVENGMSILWSDMI